MMHGTFNFPLFLINYLGRDFNLGVKLALLVDELPENC